MCTAALSAEVCCQHTEMWQLVMQEQNEVNWISQPCYGYSEPFLSHDTTHTYHTREQQSREHVNNYSYPGKNLHPIPVLPKLPGKSDREAFFSPSIFFVASKQSWEQSRSTSNITGILSSQNTSLLKTLPMCLFPTF